MRALSLRVTAFSLGLVTEGLLASIVAVSGMFAVFDQGIGPCDSLPPFFIILFVVHYPGLIVAQLLHFPRTMAFWSSAIVSVFMWSAVWYLLLKIFGEKHDTA
jgi:hypothetical protein